MKRLRPPSRAAACLCSIGFALCIAAPAHAAPLKIIFDTDMDSDVDDVAALAMLHSQVDDGTVDLLAIMISGHNEWSAPCVDALNTFRGRPDIPIGHVASSRGIRQDSAYARGVATGFPQDYEAKHEKIDACALYRKVLAIQPDQSVSIVSVGDLTNLAALLDSKPDAHSAMDGLALVKAKVVHYVCMGSRYPAETDSGTNRWGNFRTDPESTREVNDRWPTMLTFTGGGKFADSMAIGSQITTLDPKTSPVSLAYRLYFGKNWPGKKRHTADSIAVLAAVRGLSPWFKVVDHGHNEIDDIGRNAWQAEPDVENRRYTSELINPAQAPELAAFMEGLAMREPVRRGKAGR